MLCNNIHCFDEDLQEIAYRGIWGKWTYLGIDLFAGFNSI